MRRRWITAIVGLALFMGGCTTYINIPEQRGDVASHDINDGTAVAVVAVAMKHVLDRFSPNQQYGLTLPGNPTRETYSAITNSLRPGISAIVDDKGNTPTFAVKQVIVRGWSAQIDVVEPTQYSTSQLISVYLSHDISGWYVARSRIWRVPVDQKSPPIPVEDPAADPNAPARSLQKPPAQPVETTPKPAAEPKADQPKTPAVDLDAASTEDLTKLLNQTQQERAGLQVQFEAATRAGKPEIAAELDAKIKDATARIALIRQLIAKPAETPKPADPVFIKPGEQPAPETKPAPADGNPAGPTI